MGLQETIKAIQADPKNALVEFKADVRNVTGIEVVATSRDHAIIVDEPADLDGTDKGANPVELLLQALGSCNTIATLAFAKALGVNVEAISTEVSGKLDLRGFLGLDPSVRPGVLEINMKTHIKSNDPKEKINELREFAEAHCPVKDTLSKGTKVKNELVLD
ncbi:MAG: OsmC family protein [Thermoprotei archaeon]